MKSTLIALVIAPLFHAPAHQHVERCVRDNQNYGYQLCCAWSWQTYTWNDCFPIPPTIHGYPKPFDWNDR